MNKFALIVFGKRVRWSWTGGFFETFRPQDSSKIAVDPNTTPAERPKVGK